MAAQRSAPTVPLLRARGDSRGWRFTPSSARSLALVLALALAFPLAPAPARADLTERGEREREREREDPVRGMLERMTTFLHQNEVAGITPDPRIAINPTEANRLSVVSQLLGFNQLERLHPSRVARQDVIARANFLVDHFGEVSSGTAFDGMLGYAMLGAYECTGDSRYLEKGRIVVERSLVLSGWQNTLNWGLMSTLALSKYYALTGDQRARVKTIEILASLRPYQNGDGSFPHYCPGSKDVHYTAWMSMELLIVRRWVPSPLIDLYLAGTRRFLEERTLPAGITQYQVPCVPCPGGWIYFYGLGSGCYVDYDTRGWVNELGYTSLLFGDEASPRYGDVIGALEQMQSAGAFPDKWGYLPGPQDPIYPWASANPSVIRTSVIFWSLAELEADRVAARLARDDDHGDSGPGDSPADELLADFSVPASPESLALATVQGHELGAPSWPLASGAGEVVTPDLVPVKRRAAARSEPVGAAAAPALRLGPILPNPSRAGCVIAFSLERDAPVSLEIYDIAGRLVRSLARERMNAGEHRVRWDGNGPAGAPPPAGLYFARLQAGPRYLTARLVTAP